MGAEEATNHAARMDGIFQAQAPQADEPLKSPWMDTEGASAQARISQVSRQRTRQIRSACVFFMDSYNTNNKYGLTKIHPELDGLLTKSPDEKTDLRYTGRECWTF
jgi:hypothetical protein